METGSLEIRILSPEGTLFDGQADALFVPGAYCPFEVLPGHAPIISTLSEGSVRWRTGGKEEKLAVKGGVIRVEHNEIKICAVL